MAAAGSFEGFVAELQTLILVITASVSDSSVLVSAKRWAAEEEVEEEATRWQGLR